MIKIIQSEVDKLGKAGNPAQASILITKALLIIYSKLQLSFVKFERKAACLWEMFLNFGVKYPRLFNLWTAFFLLQTSYDCYLSV